VIKRLSRPRPSVVVDSISQAVSLGKARAYVKMLLNLNEHRLQATRGSRFVAFSECVTREKVPGIAGPL